MSHLSVCLSKGNIGLGMWLSWQSACLACTRPWVQCLAVHICDPSPGEVTMGRCHLPVEHLQCTLRGPVSFGVISSEIRHSWPQDSPSSDFSNSVILGDSQVNSAIYFWAFFKQTEGLFRVSPLPELISLPHSSGPFSLVHSSGPHFPFFL